METEQPDARIRIMDAAAAIFAEHGFAATTIRMICGRAGVNLSAVNYHFGSKEGLYRETIRHLRKTAYERYPLTWGLSPDAGPEEQLLAYIRSFLLRTTCDERNMVFGRLVMREMSQPTSALDMMVDEGIRSLFGRLVEITRMLMGEGAREESVLACSRGVISQCLFFLFSKAVIDRMSPEHRFDTTDVDMISGEILSFSLHAIRGMAAEEGPRQEKEADGR